MPALSTQFKFTIIPTGTGTTTATSVALPSIAVSDTLTPVFKSQKEKGDGYFGNSDGFHTVTYTVTPNFLGTLTTQATLATYPTENDWFEVADSKFEYKNLVNPVLTTTTNYVNFTGNFVWVRAFVHRSDDQPNGSVQQINYNH